MYIQYTVLKYDFYFSSSETERKRQRGEMEGRRQRGQS
jgi:hypothetical protein